MLSVEKMVKNTTKLYKICRNHYKSFEERHNKFAVVFLRKNVTEPLSHFMKEIQGAVH